MTNKLAIPLSVVVVMGVAAQAWSQNPVTVDSPFQLRYATNLNVADSFVNITNSGALGAGLAGGTGASTVGAICANVYVFNPDESMAACCSCPVTPNGLVHLSARRDLISNTLTPAVPNSIVIKLLGSVPVGGTCSAAAPGALTAGLLAWGTTTHVETVTTTVPNTNSMCTTYCNGAYPYYESWCSANCQPTTRTTTTQTATETPFLPATLSAGELAKLTQSCTLINNIGSGFGICRSCRQGGQ